MSTSNNPSVPDFADSGILAIRYRELVEEIEKHQKDLWKEIRGSANKNGQLIPVFTEKAQEPLEKIKAAEKMLSKLINDCEEFSQIVKPYKSFRELELARDRELRAEVNAKHNLKAVTEHAAKRGVLAEAIADDPQVMEAALKVDKAMANSRAGELTERLKAAREILSRYYKNE